MDDQNQNDQDMLGQYIVDANYPASKQDLLNHAENKGASEGVIQLIQSLPDQQYNSASEVTNAAANEAA